MAVPVTNGPSNLAAPANGQPTETRSGGYPADPALIFQDDPINILIVDDEPRNLTVLETVLNDPSYRLVRAGSADGALLALVAGEFALLILDVRMPGMTGFELAQMIKTRRKTALVPIIFLTAYYNEDEHMLEGYDTGAVDYLLKPVNPVILRSKVSVFAELYRKNRESQRINRLLLAEVAERRRTQDQLHELNENLEQQVTERTAALMKTRVALQETNERYRSLFEGSLDAIFSIGTDGRFEAANPAALRLAGRSLVELKSIHFLDICAPDQRKNARQAFRAAFGHECTTIDTAVITATGERRELLISGTPTLVDGKVAGLSYIAHDITERKRIEEHNKLLMAEVNHRAKNLLAVVQALAQQTARHSDPAVFVERLSERIAGLAASQDLLVRNQWSGVDVADLVQVQLSHFKDLIGTRVLIEGQRVLTLNMSAAQGIGMALHELATNAAKYGALSNLDGQVRITWQIIAGAKPAFLISWQEDGGPFVTAPTRKGFGQVVIGGMAEAAVEGRAEIVFRESGLSWTLRAPVENALALTELGLP